MEAPEDLSKQDLLPARDPVLLRGIPRGEDAPSATSMPLHGAPFPCDFVRVLPLAVGLRGEIDDPQQVLERCTGHTKGALSVTLASSYLWLGRRECRSRGGLPSPGHI